MMKTKLVYQNNNTTKILWGQIPGEDEIFISFITEDENHFRINKKSVISIKRVGVDNDS